MKSYFLVFCFLYFLCLPFLAFSDLSFLPFFSFIYWLSVALSYPFFMFSQRQLSLI